MRNHVLVTAAITLALVTSACSRSPGVSFYTLSPVAKAEAPVSPQAAKAIAVGPVSLPEVVDRPQLVVRVAENRVRILETHRWAEPLKSEIPRLVARNLGLMLGSNRVSYYGQNAAADADYRVLLDILRLEAVPGESVTVEANWSMRRTGSDKRVGYSLVQEKVHGADYEALVSAFSRALAGVSGDIAKALLSEAGSRP